MKPVILFFIIFLCILLLFLLIFIIHKLMNEKTSYLQNTKGVAGFGKHQDILEKKDANS